MTTTTPNVPAVTGGVLLFRSCLISTEYPGAEAATKWLFERFGIEYAVLPEQTCCTGLGYYSELVPVATSVALAARNACVAVESGHPVMSYLCSTCYAINKKARNILDVPEYRAEANKCWPRSIAPTRTTVAATIGHSHTMEILWSAHHSIPGLVRRRLDGIKVATHPACHYCKVFPDEVVGDSENFMIPEDLLEDTGVVKTGPYNEKTTHCGAGFRQRFVNPSIAVAVTREKLRRLAQEKVDVLRPHVPELRHPVRPPPRASSRNPRTSSTPSCTSTCSSSSPWRWEPTPTRICGVASHSQDVEPLLERIGARDAVAVRRPELPDESRRLSVPVRRQHLGGPRPRRPGRQARAPRRRRLRRASTSSCAAPRATS